MLTCPKPRLNVDESLLPSSFQNVAAVDGSRAAPPVHRQLMWNALKGAAAGRAKDLDVELVSVTQSIPKGYRCTAWAGVTEAAVVAGGAETAAVTKLRLRDLLNRRGEDRVALAEYHTSSGTGPSSSTQTAAPGPTLAVRPWEHAADRACASYDTVRTVLPDGRDDPHRPEKACEEEPKAHLVMVWSRVVPCRDTYSGRRALARCASVLDSELEVVFFAVAYNGVPPQRDYVVDLGQTVGPPAGFTPPAPPASVQPDPTPMSPASPSGAGGSPSRAEEHPARHAAWFGPHAASAMNGRDPIRLVVRVVETACPHFFASAVDDMGQIHVVSLDTATVAHAVGCRLAELPNRLSIPALVRPSGDGQGWVALTLRDVMRLVQLTAAVNTYTPLGGAGGWFVSLTPADKLRVALEKRLSDDDLAGVIATMFPDATDAKPTARAGGNDDATDDVVDLMTPSSSGEEAEAPEAHPQGRVEWEPRWTDAVLREALAAIHPNLVRGSEYMQAYAAKIDVATARTIKQAAARARPPAPCPPILSRAKFTSLRYGITYQGDTLPALNRAAALVWALPYPPGAPAVVDGAEEAVHWAPRGAAVGAWVHGLLAPGNVVQTVCPARPQQRWPHGCARALVLVTAALEAVVLCFCAGCCARTALHERMFDLPSFAAHMCAGDDACSCSVVPGHVLVYGVADDEGDVSVPPVGAPPEPRAVIMCRPVWRWARLEQVWCALRQRQPAYDWDALLTPAGLAPPTSPAQGDDAAPPEGWRGDGYPA